MIKNGESISRNRRASFDYFIEEKSEVGVVLSGTEVKSLRNARVKIDDAYVGEYQGEMCIFNLNIPEYKFANKFNHVPRRIRVLLLRKKEIRKMLGKVKIAGYSVIPLSMYFNNRGFVKLSIALAKGKKNIDKREVIKNREWDRQKASIIKNLNS